MPSFLFVEGEFLMFISDKFYLDGVHSDEIGVSLITLDSDVINDYGLKFDTPIENETTSSSNPTYTNAGDNIDTIILNICSNNGLWDGFLLEEVYQWILKDKFMPLISEDDLEMVYYVKPIKIIKMFTYNMAGYLEVTFQPLSNHAYKRDMKKINVTVQREIKIKNTSNSFDEYYPPIIIIENLGDERTIISIDNTTLEGEAFEITGLKNKEKIIIDNASCTVLNELRENKLSKCNRKWVRFKKGYNTLILNGECNITIKSEFPYYR